ncbi:MAG: MBL fold metallo-hydrolase [Desulfobacteraceae bacterium]|jgi:glyoxylase-like metal-dependent hydrolase (beta-lactamase superfamily II)|nr:MBL fold metallo-hydrolase [Desulfobacteraceae bacterium]
MIKLAKDLYLIEGDNNARFPFCNAFLITGSQTVLIDTGIGVEKLKAIDRKKRIDRVIISHSHPDHIAGCDVLWDRHLMLPEETGEEVHDLLMLGMRFTGSLEDGKKWAAFVRSVLNIEPLGAPDARYGNGDILDFGTVRLEAIHVPGHLNDHYCFFDQESKTMLSTDIDFSSFGPWYGNPECAIKPFIKGIRKVMTFPYDQVCSSHKLPIASAAAKGCFEQFLGMFDRHRQQILGLCDSPTTLDQMAAISPFYSNKLKGTIVQDVFEKNMILKNLELLVRDGLVVNENGYFKQVKTI